MYHILESRKLTESLNSLPTVREIHFDDVIEIRRSIGQGAYAERQWRFTDFQLRLLWW